MLQRLPIALAHVKAGNKSENLLKEIRQIVYSLYQSKEITKKVYSNLIKSIKMNSENSKTSKSHVLILNLTRFKKRWQTLLYQIFVFIIHGKT